MRPDSNCTQSVRMHHFIADMHRLNAGRTGGLAAPQKRLGVIG